MLHRPAHGPLPSAMCSLIYSHTESVHGEKYPKDNKTTTTTKYLSPDLSPHNVGGDEHCYRHKNWAMRDMARDGTLAGAEGLPSLNCQTSPVISENQTHTKKTVKGGPRLSQGTGWCLHTEVKRVPCFCQTLPTVHVHAVNLPCIMPEDS